MGVTFQGDNNVTWMWQRLFSRFIKNLQANFLWLACRICAFFETQKVAYFYLQSWGCVKLRVQGANLRIFRKINCIFTIFCEIFANLRGKAIFRHFARFFYVTFLQKLAVTWRVGVSNIEILLKTRCRDSIKWSFLLCETSQKSVPVLLHFARAVSVF